MEEEKKGPKENCLYFDISRQERDASIRFLLSAIIKCRNDDGFPSNHYTYDEDVNVYLAHLLFAISLPEYHDMAEPYLSSDSNEIMQWINDADDQTIRYFIFKVNADHILIHTAIFDDLETKGRKGFFKHSKKYFRELAKLYYEQAASYHKRIYRRQTGVGDVLDKVAYYFENYQEVLKRVRREYFHFLNNFRDKAFHGFMDQVTHYEKDNIKKAKLDEFLDIYGTWLESKDKHLEERLIRIVQEIRAVDPAFKFDVIDKFRNDRGDFSDDQRKCA